MRILILSFFVVIMLIGCQSNSTTDRALIGGGLGAATGAIIGDSIGDGKPGAAVPGAIIGGAAGAIIGAATAPPPAPVIEGEPPRECVGYDRYGNPFPIVCPDVQQQPPRRTNTHSN